MIISSYGLALLTAVCIELPGWTIISAADPIPETNSKRKITTDKTSIFFLICNPSVHSENWG